MLTYVLQQEQPQWHLMDYLLQRKNSFGSLYLLVRVAVFERFCSIQGGVRNNEGGHKVTIINTLLVFQEA